MRLIDADSLICVLKARFERFKELVPDIDNSIEFAHSYALDSVTNAPTISEDWIPCSERLPSESGWYVVSVVGFENITDVSYFYSDESKWSDVSHTQSVVAWMPLPTPYKGGNE